MSISNNKFDKRIEGKTYIFVNLALVLVLAGIATYLDQILTLNKLCGVTYFDWMELTIIPLWIFSVACMIALKHNGKKDVKWLMFTAIVCCGLAEFAKPFFGIVLHIDRSFGFAFFFVTQLCIFIALLIEHPFKKKDLYTGLVIGAMCAFYITYWVYDDRSNHDLKMKIAYPCYIGLLNLLLWRAIVLFTRDRSYFIWFIAALCFYVSDGLVTMHITWNAGLAFTMWLTYFGAIFAYGISYIKDTGRVL